MGRVPDEGIRKALAGRTKMESQEKRRTGTIDVGDAASIFAPCAEYTGREVMELLGGIIRREQQETALGAYGSFVPCRECVYVQHLFDGGMCRRRYL